MIIGGFTILSRRCEKAPAHKKIPNVMDISTKDGYFRSLTWQKIKKKQQAAMNAKSWDEEVAPNKTIKSFCDNNTVKGAKNMWKSVQVEPLREIMYILNQCGIKRAIECAKDRGLSNDLINIVTKIEERWPSDRMGTYVC